MEILFGEDRINSFIKDCVRIISLEEGKRAIVGIKTGGYFLAKRIWQEIGDEDVKLGSVDITFWRDDLSRNPYPVVKGSEIDFSLDDCAVFLIDDVIWTGRTIRSALCEIFEYGRPKYIKLFTLVSRTGRELPIHPDYFSFHISLPAEKSVEVLLREKGFPKDIAVILSRGEVITPEKLK